MNRGLDRRRRKFFEITNYLQLKTFDVAAAFETRTSPKKLFPFELRHDNARGYRLVAETVQQHRVAHHLTKETKR